MSSHSELVCFAHAVKADPKAVAHRWDRASCGGPCAPPTSTCRRPRPRSSHWLRLEIGSLKNKDMTVRSSGSELIHSTCDPLRRDQDTDAQRRKTAVCEPRPFVGLPCDLAWRSSPPPTLLSSVNAVPSALSGLALWPLLEASGPCHGIGGGGGGLFSCNPVWASTYNHHVHYGFSVTPFPPISPKSPPLPARCLQSLQISISLPTRYLCIWINSCKFIVDQPREYLLNTFVLVIFSKM